MLKKIRLFKRILELSKEVNKIYHNNYELYLELRQLFETAKILFPNLIGVLNEIIELIKDDSNKKVRV
jgi:hypothetical protein